MEGKNFKNVRSESFQDYLSECNSYKVNRILKKGFQCNTTVSYLRAYFQVTTEVVMQHY